MNPARQAAIGGGLPVEVSALTVNRAHRQWPVARWKSGRA